MEPWSVKYIPKSTSEVQGQNLAISNLRNYLKNFEKGKAALIYGPPGCGKTSSVYAFARETDLEMIEVNASDARDSDSIKQRLGNAISQVSLFSKGKIILVDELDGISGSADRGGLSTLSELIDKTTFPIIMTANDPYDQKFSALRKKSEMIEFHSLAYPSVLAVLRRIADKEGVKCDETALASLARRAGGDLRGAINDFQTLSQHSGKLDISDVEELSGRKQKETMINALMRIFKTTDPQVALHALDDTDEETDGAFLWVEENIPIEYKRPEDIAAAFDSLSLADVFRGRIRKREHWRFLVYINDLLTAGIALSKKEKYHGFNKYIRPTRVLRIWQANQKNAKRKEIARKIAEKTHTSYKRALKDTLPYIRPIFRNNKQQAKQLSEYFDFDKEEAAYLSQ